MYTFSASEIWVIYWILLNFTCQSWFSKEEKKRKEESWKLKATILNWYCYLCSYLCSNSVNIYVGIGVPWLIDTLYNFIAYREPLRIQNAEGLSFSLLVFFCTSVGCIAVLVFRRLTLGAELGGPRLWAWVTCIYFMFLWLIFVVLSSFRVSGII